MLRVLAVAALLSVPAFAAPSPPVQQAARQSVQDGATSSVVVVVDGLRTYAAAQPPRPAPERIRFRIGSVTKTFTATVVLQLVREGRVALGAPVARYLPWTGSKGRRIRIRDLLNHRSGLVSYTDFGGWMAEAEASKTIRPRAVLRFALGQDLLFRPRSRWSYSNSNYAALGLVVEAVTQRSFADELERRIIRPLGLGGTELAATRKVRGLADPGTNPWLPWAAGGIVSSPRDVARFYSALLGGRLLPQRLLDEMKRTVAAGGLGRYGLGIFPTPLRCGIAWGHDGGILDYATRVLASSDGTRVLVQFARRPGSHWSPVDPLLCP